MALQQQGAIRSLSVSLWQIRNGAVKHQKWRPLSWHTRLKKCRQEGWNYSQIGQPSNLDQIVLNFRSHCWLEYSTSIQIRLLYTKDEWFHIIEKVVLAKGGCTSVNIWGVGGRKGLFGFMHFDWGQVNQICLLKQPYLICLSSTSSSSIQPVNVQVRHYSLGLHPLPHIWKATLTLVITSM